MKVVYKLILSALVLVALMFGYVFYDSHWSASANIGEKNISNSRKVESQMSQEDVLFIMGKPDTIIKDRFCYITYDDSYPYIEFSFDSLNRVKEIYSPEKMTKG